MKVLAEKADDGSWKEAEDLIKLVEDKTGQKRPPRKEKPVYKFGKSCGFMFTTVDMLKWTCVGTDVTNANGASMISGDSHKGCNVTVTTNEELLITENNHYFKYISKC